MAKLREDIDGIEYCCSVPLEKLVPSRNFVIKGTAFLMRAIWSASSIAHRAARCFACSGFVDSRPYLRRSHPRQSSICPGRLSSFAARRRAPHREYRRALAKSPYPAAAPSSGLIFPAMTLEMRFSTCTPQRTFRMHWSVRCVMASAAATQYAALSRQQQQTAVRERGALLFKGQSFCRVVVHHGCNCRKCVFFGNVLGNAQFKKVLGNAQFKKVLGNAQFKKDGKYEHAVCFS